MLKYFDILRNVAKCFFAVSGVAVEARGVDEISRVEGLRAPPGEHGEGPGGDQPVKWELQISGLFYCQNFALLPRYDLRPVLVQVIRDILESITQIDGFRTNMRIGWEKMHYFVLCQ